MNGCAAPSPDDLDGAEQLVERHGDRAYRLALRIIGAKDEAEQVIQDALLMAASTIHSFADEQALESWIYRTVARAASQRRRDRQRGDESALSAVVAALPGAGRHFESMEDWSARLDEPALQSGLRAILNEAVEALPAAYRTALVLRDVEGAAWSDIAGILDVDMPAVKAYVHRARLFVRRRLSEHFETKRA
jgi:RNA polymerase sigma-70 factor (ECF subfamily)